ncbi:YtxH domain-containing protein [Olsenella sp. HMSC062G07]|uniref:YtxH domain-containing protein n=1 Tax=Olsenella sp. HMSC062G07 TaxID=1739330 RepID=UPI0008A33A10|nr:YtxH domain-containing protein [Olsenella sp. HMSC062G07]OFK22185.1 2,3,4,5-tetrahydropyridine-2,6-carboxylate N-succinyltransferase [Olsenella sp. HMSC062G07]
MSARGTLGFVVGSIFGAAAGVMAGLLLAPRTGSESRARVADAMNDAWDSAVDTYERSSRVVGDKINSVRPNVDATTDELRAKVDLARERMDQLRSSLSDAVSTTSSQVQEAVNSVAEKVAEGMEDVKDDVQEAVSVHVEVVDGDAATAEDPNDVEEGK